MPFRPTRRDCLRAAGSLVALPVLESLGAAAPATGPGSAARPKRIAFLGIGFGVTKESWFPDVKQTGPGYPLTPGLAPLERHKDSFTLVQGCCHKNSVDPHHGSTYWLTGADKYGEPGKAFHNTVSADQVAAAHLGGDTRYTSIQLSGSEPKLDGFGHGPGLSLSWDYGGKPMAAFNTPVVAFQRLFADDTQPLAVRQAALVRGESVLDAVLEDARDMQRHVGTDDRHKLDEYFESIRDIEARLAKEKSWLEVPKPKPPCGEPQPGVEGKEEVRLMYDLMVAAFQTDSTRVATFRQPIQHLLKSLDIDVAAHDMSHYNPGERTEASQRRDVAQSELLAGLIDRLKATKEPDGSSLFDHVILCFGSNISTGHTLLNCPTLLVGGGAGIKLGHHLVLPDRTPLCNVWLTMLRGIGVSAESFGDSTGIVEELMA